MINELLTSETFWRKQKLIVGSSRVPISEIKEWKKNINFKNVRILDLGSGSGRSTKMIEKNFPKAKVFALDISSNALKNRNYKNTSRLQGNILNLTFPSESFDFVILCGVLTNITDEDKEKAIIARKNVAKEVARVLKKGGLCIVSDFNSKHVLSNYDVDYRRHELITGEWGTVAVFDPAKNINFYGKSDEEIKDFKNSPDLLRYAHHYSRQELIAIFDGTGLQAFSYKAEVGITPSGHKIDSIVYSFTK